MPTIDWKNMEQIDKEANEPLPAGTYVFRVESGKWGVSKSDASVPQMQVMCRADEGPYKGKSVWVRLTLNEAKPGTITMFRKFLVEALGTDFSKEWGSMDEKQQEDWIVGRRFEATTHLREWQGRKNADFKEYVRPLSGPPAPGLTPPPADTGAPAEPQSSALTPPPVNPMDEV